MLDECKEFMTIEEAAELLGMSRFTFDKIVKDFGIKRIKYGRWTRITRDDLKIIIEKLREK